MNRQSFPSDRLTLGTHSEGEVYRKPANHVLRDVLLSLGMNTESDVSVKDCFEITREAMHDPCMRYVKVQAGEPRVMAVCHREP